jgi:hypothetical protein
MKVIGRGHRTKERIGSHLTMTANDITRDTGMGDTAALNTFTTRITTETATTMIMTDMMTTIGTVITITTTRNNAPYPNRRSRGIADLFE